MNPKTTISYKELSEYVSQMEDSANLLKNMVYNSLEDDGYNISKIEEFHKNISLDELKMQSVDEHIKKIFDAVGDFTDEKIKNICRIYHEVDEAPSSGNSNDKSNSNTVEESPEELQNRMKIFDDNYETTKYDFMKKVIIHVYEQMDEIDSTYKECDELKAKSSEAIDDYVNYLTSDEYLAKKKERLDALKKSADECVDPAEKKKSLEMINIIESSMDLSFINKKMDKLGEKEYKAIEINYFDNNRSNYNLEKFKSKIGKFGYKSDIYSHFFNIEEKYLEEKYHVFNNLFLFFIIRFVAYADPYKSSDKLYVQSILSNTANLVYHKFSSQDQEEKFLSIIRNFLDKFEGSYDRFNKDNILHPNHPQRIAKRKEQSDSVRGMVYQNLKELGVEITQEIEDMSMDDLRVFYNTKLQEPSKVVVKTPMSELIDLLKDNIKKSDDSTSEETKTETPVEETKTDDEKNTESDDSTSEETKTETPVEETKTDVNE